MLPIRLSAFLWLAWSAAAQVPAGTNLDLSLVTPVDQASTPKQPDITFKLRTDLKLPDGVIPKESLVSARVTFIHKGSAFVHGVPRNYFIVGMRLVALSAGDKTIPVSANLESIGPTNTQDDYFVPNSHRPERWGALSEYKFLFKLPQRQPGESFLGVVREGLRLPKDLRMVFRSEE